MFLCQTNSSSPAATLSVLWVTPQLEQPVQNAWKSTGTSYGWCTAERMRAKTQGKGPPNQMYLGFIYFILACLQECLLGHIIFACTCHISFPVAPFLRFLSWLRPSRHHAVWSLHCQTLITQISKRFMTYLGHPYFTWQVECIRNNTSCELEAFTHTAIHEVDLCMMPQESQSREANSEWNTYIHPSGDVSRQQIKQQLPFLTPLLQGSY